MISDNSGCSISDSVEITEPLELLANASADTTEICEGGTINLTAVPQGGTGLFTSFWTGTGAAYLSSTDTLTPVFTGAIAGIYDLVYTVTDENGCVADTLLTVNVNPISVFDSITSICAGELVADWNGQIIDNTQDSIYNTILSNMFGCDSLLSLTVNINPISTYDSTTAICEGDIVADWNGHIVDNTKDSIYSTTLSSIFGCDSVLTLNITVLPGSITVLDTIVEQGTPDFVWNGQTIITDNDSIYQDTLVNINGCDSIVTVDITVVPVDITETDTMICDESAPFVWNGQDVITTIDSSYTAVYTNRYGHDSTLVLNVDIIPLVPVTIDSTLCEGTGTFTWNGQTIFTDRDSTYSTTLTNSLGCDSVLTLNITVLPGSITVLDTIVEQGTPDFVWNGQTIITDNDSIYQDTLVNINGCDSIVTVDITVVPVDITETDTMICDESAPFVWNGQDVITTIDSSYTAVYTNRYGHDSTLILNVDIIPLVPVTIDSTLCEGTGTFTWNGQTIFTDRDSTYSTTLTNSLGCDSVLTLNITVLPGSITVLDTIVEQGTPDFVWNGQTIITDNDSIYQDTLVNINGCDSIVTVDITVVPVDITEIDTMICDESAPFVWNGQDVITTIDSSYTAVYTNRYGHDSTLVLNVDIIPLVPVTIDSTLCEGTGTFTWNGQTIFTDRDSTYSTTLTNSLGCDSVLTLNITVLPGSITVLDTIVEQGTPDFVWNGQTIITDNDSIYQDTLVNINGCDSIVTVDITVVPVDITETDTMICDESAPFVWNGQDVITTIDSSYTAVYTNRYGHDSTLILNVDIIPLVPVTIDSTLCEGTGTFTWNGQTIFTDRDSTYSTTLTNSLGCDSVLTLNITVLPGSITVLDTIVEQGTPDFVWNGQTIITDNDSIYQDTLVNINGCDSIVTVDITVVPVDITETDTMICDESAPFVWNGQDVITTIDSSYTAVYTNRYGHDSTLILNVDIIPLVPVTIDSTLCEGTGTFTWNGQTIFTDRDSTYSTTLTNSLGCDSVLTLNITVLPGSITVLDTIVEQGTPDFVWNGQTIITDNDSIYQDTLVNINGCDSIVTVDITVVPVDITETDTMICDESAPFVWNGQDVITTIDSSYTAVYTNRYGHDSTIDIECRYHPVSTCNYRFDLMRRHGHIYMERPDYLYRQGQYL